MSSFFLNGFDKKTCNNKHGLTPDSNGDITISTGASFLSPVASTGYSSFSNMLLDNTCVPERVQTRARRATMQ